MENKKKILIVGASAKEYALAKYFSKQVNIEKVFIAPGNEAAEEFSTRVDIREDSISELLEFAIKNDIDLTIACSSAAIKANIANDFNENNQPIFAPSAECSGFATSRGTGKKYLYKLHIPTPKFGIFEKQQLALDYVKKEKMPLLITTDGDIETSVRAVCANVNLAQTCINDIFFQDEKKVVIEEYAYGHTFSLYVISDGYQALPLGIVGDYKFKEDGDGGLFTLGTGAYSPDYKISFDVIQDIMQNVIYKILQDLEKKGTPYLGIMGIECVLTSDNKYNIVGFTPFLKDHDAQVVLNSLDINLSELMFACINGSFADDYEDIPINDNSYVSCVLYSSNEDEIITGLDKLDELTDVTHFNTAKNSYLEWLTNAGRTLVITQTAGTISRARELLYENVEEIKFKTKKYRKDICS